MRAGLGDAPPKPQPTARGKPKPSPDLACSFCGRSTSEVEQLIAGPGVNICDGCVAICVEVLSKLPADGE